MVGSVRIPLTIWNGLQLGLVAGLACIGTGLAFQGSGSDVPLGTARIASRTLAAAIERGLADVERDARTAGLVVGDLDAGPAGADRGAMLRRWLDLHPAYADVWLVGADGLVRAAAVSGAGRDLSGQPWFRRTRGAETAVTTEGGGVALVVALAQGGRLVLRAGPGWLAGLDAQMRAGLPGDGSNLAVSVAGADGQILLGQAPARPLPPGRIEATAQTAAGRDLANPGWSVTAAVSDGSVAAGRPNRRVVLLSLALTLAGGALGYAFAAGPARRLRRLIDPDGGDAPAPSPIAEIDALERLAAEGKVRDGHGFGGARNGLGRVRARLATFAALSGWQLWEIDPQTHRVVWSDAAHDEPGAGDRSTDLADLVSGIAPADRAVMRLTMQAALREDGAHDVTLRTVGGASPDRRLLVRFRRGETPADGTSPRLFALSRELADGADAPGTGAERRRDHVLRRVTDGIVHDFNDVLTVVLANLDSLTRRYALDPAQARLVDRAVSGAERGAALTRRMVGLVRSGAEESGEADLVATVRAVLPFLRAQVLGDMPVMNRLPPELPPVRCGEPVIETILLNLAFHFRDAGLDGFALAGGEEAGDQGDAPEAGVRLVVASGRPAQSGSLATNPASPDAPAYLDIVARLLERAGGRLSVASDGTGPLPFLANLWLPAQVRSPMRAQAPVAPAARLRVLLVEGDGLVRASLAGALADLGHTAVQAASGERALEILAGPERFDAMIAALSMPAMSGLQLAAAVVERHPNVPVIVAGPHGHLPEGTRHVLALDKPFRPADLAAVLAKVGAASLARAA